MHKLEPTIAGVGYLGIGDYPATMEGKPYPVYTRWSGMVHRCYNPKDPSYKYYGAKGVTVCERWLCYQNFADDYTRACHKIGVDPENNPYQLDKDILSTGSEKVYSPETCCFALPRENIKARNYGKTFRLVSPEGVTMLIHNLSRFCKKHGLQQGNLCRVMSGKSKHHKGWTAA